MLFIVGSVFASDLFSYPSFGFNSRPYKDYWGNSYKYYNNLWKDTDGDGIINYYDYNDRNPRIWTPYQKRTKKWRW